MQKNPYLRLFLLMLVFAVLTACTQAPAPTTAASGEVATAEVETRGVWQDVAFRRIEGGQTTLGSLPATAWDGAEQGIVDSDHNAAWGLGAETVSPLAV